jgi:hypothetical protein
MEYSLRYGRFRALLRNIREEAGLSQRALAGQLGNPPYGILEGVEETRAWSGGRLPRSSKGRRRRKPLTYTARASTLLDGVNCYFKDHRSFTQA